MRFIRALFYHEDQGKLCWSLILGLIMLGLLMLSSLFTRHLNETFYLCLGMLFGILSVAGAYLEWKRCGEGNHSRLLMVKWTVLGFMLFFGMLFVLLMR